MLQLPSHSEATERKSLLSNQEIKKFRTSQQQAITVKKTTYYDMNVFEKWPKNERSWKSPPEELYRLLCNFHITATKKYNSKYATDAMSSFSRSIQRFLDENNAKVNILKDKKFKVSREVPRCKRREFRNQSKGNKPNATVALTNEDVERIFEENQFDVHELEVVERTMWCLLNLQFGEQQARHESIQIKFGDIP